MLSPLNTLLAIVLLAASTGHGAGISAVTSERCRKMERSGVISKQTPVRCNRLRRVTFSYINFEGKEEHQGEIMVLDAVANQVSHLVDELRSIRFPIHMARTMEHFKGNDDASMAANNTSAFNDRPITGQPGTVSIHAYGLAIDINPVMTPYLELSENGQPRFIPPAGTEYANRSLLRLDKPFRPGMAEQVINLFARHGFLYWGGYWDTPIDYQHFQVSREMAEFMAAAPYSLARDYFEQHVKYYRACEQAFPEQYQRREIQDYNHWPQKCATT